jgi:hypothetical protein
LALRDRISRSDRWPELERASRERFLDALALATAAEERPTGAAYLAGYAAEILLKTAYYRVRGLAQSDDVAGELRGMQARASELGCTWRAGRYRHDLLDLASLLVQERQIRGEPFDSYFAAALAGHVVNLTQNWSEQLRYKDVLASAQELTELFESVIWILNSYETLWRQPCR